MIRINISQFSIPSQQLCKHVMTLVILKNYFNFNLKTNNPPLVAQEIQYLVHKLRTQEIEIFTWQATHL
jgi:hypothetical protein